MILLTGASGFLGQHLLHYLSANGSNVRALYNNQAPSASLRTLPGVEWLKYDLLDIYAVEEAMHGIDEVYHCAAIMSFHPKKREEMLHFNAESTANIVNQALEQGIRKMVHISSVAALGRQPENVKEIGEEEQWEESRGNSAYGMSKYQAEMEVWRGIGEGLHAVIVNPGIILGEGNWDKGSSQIMKTVYKEFPFYTEGVNAWVDVQDVVKICCMLMDSDVEAERFIISAGNATYKDILVMMAKALGKKAPGMKANTFMTGAVWRYERFKSLLNGSDTLITKETSRNAHSKSYYNNGKLLKLFPDYSYNSPEAAIKRMAEAFLNDVNKKN
jgi:dihydroflavonol-4-reductase